ncbi:MAG: hypothetical protein M3P18_22470 [Actinomycetota bacterium]|nr:hypothetical protein [Actinomycetota bacterium]
MPALQREGRRRRRNRLFAYVTLVVVVAGSAGVLGPHILRASRSSRRVAPIQTPSPQPTQRQQHVGFNDLRTGWTQLPSPPEVRTITATAWGGGRLFVWGGIVYTGMSGEPPLSDGFVFDSRSRTWSKIAPSPLAARVLPATAWTGKEFLVWGGRGGDAQQPGFFKDGAAYNPATDNWKKLPPAPVGARAPWSVWTGKEFIVWGNASRTRRPARDGAAFDPATTTWHKIAAAPIGLTDATAVWTGHEMVVFGAALDSGNIARNSTAIGAAYNPKTNTWRRLPDTKLSPQASTAAWDGHEMIAWDYLNHTAAYDPQTDFWRRLPPVPLHPAECRPQSVALDRFVVGDYCGSTALFDPTSTGYGPAEGAWHDVSATDLAGWGFTLVAADPVALLLGRGAQSKQEAMFAYRPPSH